MVKLLRVGAALTVALGLVAGLVWGPREAAAAAVFGALATAIQFVATRMMGDARQADFRRFAKRWGQGMALRFAGAVVWGVAVTVAPQVVHPFASALGLLGVLLPLMILELRLVH